MLTDFLHEAGHLVAKGEWHELEQLGLRAAADFSPPCAIAVREIDTTDYEDALRTAVENAAARVERKTKAFYWEFDPHNGWSSNIMLTQSFDLLGTEWAADEHGHVEGPDMGSFADLYQENRDDPAIQEALLTALVARTFGAFGRAYERAGLFERPMGAAFHDSGTILVMPRPGVDLEESYRRAEARLFKLPAGEWLVMGDRGWMSGTSIAGKAHPSKEGELTGGDFRRIFPDPSPIKDWSLPQLEVLNGALTDLLPDVRGPGVFSNPLKELIDSSLEPADVVEWLPATVVDRQGHELRYWYLHFMSAPPRLRRVIRVAKTREFEAEVLDYEACAARRLLPYQKGYKELSWFVVNRSLAESIVAERFRDLGWNRYWSTKDRAVKEILD
jgi:hypothetical protein